MSTTKPFYSILQDICAMNNWKITDVQKILYEKGVMVSYQALLNYSKCKYTPDFNIAMQILDALDYEYSKDELVLSLELNKNAKRELMDMSKQTTLVRSLRIPLRRFAKYGDVNQINDIISDRIDNTVGLQGSFNDYIITLIEKDIENSRKE